MNRMSVYSSAIRWMLMISLILAFSLSQVPSVKADTTVFYVAPTTQGLGDCSSWANACGLASALDQAEDDEEVWVKAGVYKPTSNPAARNASFFITNAIGVFGGFRGDETSLEQRDWIMHRTILSGDIDSNDLNSDGNLIAEIHTDQVGGNSNHVLTITGSGTTPIVDGFFITAGNAEEGAGGGVLIQTLAHPTLLNVDVSGCKADSGGGIALIYDADVTMIHSRLRGNYAVDWGGGLSVNDASSALVTNSALYENASDYLGGAIYNYSNSSLTLMNTLLLGNSADYGAGLYSGYASAYLKNVTAHGNVASIGGGGVYTYDASVYLENTILWGDESPSHPEIDITGTISYFDVTYSDIQGCGGSGAWNSACGVNSGGNIDLDPLFIQPDFNNLRLGLASPAVDAGDNTALPPEVTVDLDGSLRYVDIPTRPDSGYGTPPYVDMGAYEAHPDDNPPYPHSITRLDPSPSFASSVRYRVVFSEPVLGLDETDFFVTVTGELPAVPVFNIRDLGDHIHFDAAVSSGSGSGTLRLNVHQSSDVQDLRGNPLVGLPWTYGEIYEIRVHKVFMPVVVR